MNKGLIDGQTSLISLTSLTGDTVFEIRIKNARSIKISERVMIGGFFLWIGLFLADANMDSKLLSVFTLAWFFLYPIIFYFWISWTQTMDKWRDLPLSMCEEALTVFLKYPELHQHLRNVVSEGRKLTVFEYDLAIKHVEEEELRKACVRLYSQTVQN